MVVALIEINSWERFPAQNPNGLRLALGDFVIVNGEFGEDAGRIVELKELADAEADKIANSIDRAAAADDLASVRDNAARRAATLDECKETVKKSGLDMKIVDCHYSVDGKRLSFAFIADGRVDFRDLVKELGRQFQAVIRLHQMGVRDEAKAIGDIGCCGQEQCCRTHLKKLGNVTSEFAEDQQIVHRGAERLSGICGRLKCCLAYEESYYQELIKKLPPIGTRVKTVHGRGEVVGWHVLKCSVDVRIDPAGNQKEDSRPVVVEVPIKS